MMTVDLESFLARPTCPRCNIGCVRAIDIREGKHLTFQCPIPACKWTGHAPLPDIRKTLIYLDTSTISHIAGAMRSGKDSPWIDLYNSLRKAVAKEAICCLCSPIVEDEVELSKYAKEINNISKAFGNLSIKHPLEIRNNQLLRALDRYLSDDQPLLETDPNPMDAFRENVHRWRPVYDVFVNATTPSKWINSRRVRKTTLQTEFERIYQRYAVDEMSFDQIRDQEALGFGRGILEEGMKVFRQRLGLEQLKNEEESLGLWFPTTFDMIVGVLRKKLGLPFLEAIEKAEDFLLGSHSRLIPIADITSRLHAALSMMCRGQWPRQPRASDSVDIEHISAFLPYVDILITDKFFADLCNQGHMEIGKPYGSIIRSLRPTQVPTFIEEIGIIVRNAPQAALAERIANSIEEGGFHREFAERAEAYLRAHGVRPEHP
jgi:hypothetical protein